jgi:hypothetical protein
MDSLVKNLKYDDAQAASFIPPHLSGDALKSLAICSNKDSYKAIKSHLIVDYSKTKEQYWNEFINIKPKMDDRSRFASTSNVFWT